MAARTMVVCLVFLVQMLAGLSFHPPQHLLLGDVGSNSECESEMKDDNQKMAFTTKALSMDDPFVHSLSTPTDVEAALRWQAARSPEDVIREREYIITEVEKAGTVMWKSGRCADWFNGSNEQVKQVAQTVNGPMCHDFAAACNHSDTNIADIFRHGGQLYGAMPSSGIGVTKAEASAVGDIETLRSACRDSNSHLMDSIREDPHENAIHELACADAVKGWMSYPILASQCDLAEVRAVPRAGSQERRHSKGKGCGQLLVGSAWRG